MTSSPSTSTSPSHKLYSYKRLNFGFVVLCADNNPSHTRSTLKMLKQLYSAPCVAAVGEDMHKDDRDMLGKICPVYTGRKTITSLINAGMNNAPADWNIIVMGGSYLQRKLDDRFSLFIERDTDILFPIADYKYDFIDGTINGLCIHRDTFKKVGDMSDHNPLHICKMFWAMEAVKHGCKFKAIIGTKIC